MKCEVRSSCRNEAELWIHLNGKPKRSCVACSTRAIGDLQVVESHWNAPLDGPCPTAEHRALTPTERADIIAAEDRAHGQAIPLPPPTEETEARLPSSDSPPTAEPSEETDMGSKVLTLTLRPDADAHPELCRVAQCPYGDRKPRGLRRGICSADTETLRRRGIYDLFALPSTQGKAKPKPETPLTPLTASTPDVVLSEGDALLPHGAAAPPVAVPTVERSPAEAPVRLSDLTVEEMGYALWLTSDESRVPGATLWSDSTGIVINGGPDGAYVWPVGKSWEGGDICQSEREAMERLYRLALKEGRALRPIPARTMQADPPPAPPPPAVVKLQVIRQSDDDSVEAARTHLRAALSLTPYANKLPDGTPTAKAGIAALADVVGAWLKGRETRLQDVLGKTEPAVVELAEAIPPVWVSERITALEAELVDAQRDRDAALSAFHTCRIERDEALAARDRSQNELFKRAAEVVQLTRRAERAEAERDDAIVEVRGCAATVDAYADLRAKLCEVFGEDPAELTDQGIVDKATMAQHWWGRTEGEFKAFRLAVAQLVDVEEEMADPVYLRNVLRNALEQPASYGPFRVDSAVCVPSGRNQATLTWAQGDARLLPVGSLVRLTVVEVLGG